MLLLVDGSGHRGEAEQRVPAGLSRRDTWLLVPPPTNYRISLLAPSCLSGNM